MHPSTHELTIATISSLQDADCPVLFLDAELEALYRAGRHHHRPARLLVLAHAATCALAQTLRSAAARRAVL